MAERTILYIDDDKENLATLRRVLRGEVDVDTAESGFQGLAMLDKKNYSVLVADQRMPQMTGVEFLKEAVKRNGERVGLLLTAYADLDALVAGVNAGVIYRYLTKPWREEDLRSAIRQAFEKHDLVSENRRLMEELKRYNAQLKSEIDDQFDFSSIMVGTDQGLKGVANLISKVAPTQSTVLIRGESGSGKELIARAIHEASPRKSKPFVKVNCGALTETLLESELFGHEKGAFTGAQAQRIGRFEAANGGTIFLDEIGDVSPKLQVNLLRVLQEKVLERVGGNEPVEVDVRILAASHRNLEELISKGAFRQDLYFRLNVFPIVIPPLRSRMGDLPALCQRLIERGSKRTGMPKKNLSKSALTKLGSYDWPGNVRELENVLERSLILSTGIVIEEEDIALGAGMDAPAMPPQESKELDREELEKALADSQGNKMEAARRLGIKRPTLYYHLKRLGIG